LRTQLLLGDVRAEQLDVATPVRQEEVVRERLVVRQEELLDALGGRRRLTARRVPVKMRFGEAPRSVRPERRCPDAGQNSLQARDDAERHPMTTRTGKNPPGRKSEDLRVEWLRGWDSRLDDVLRALPESPGCPHSLLRLLIQNEVPQPKLVAVVSARPDEPVAVVPLRDVAGTSDVVTSWIVTGPPFPALAGWHVAALQALRRDVYVAWWPCGAGAFADAPVQDLSVLPTRRMDLRTNFEAYWRETGLHKTVRQVRNRCTGLELEVDTPGGAKWTISNWERFWRTDPESESAALRDRLLAAEHLEGLGLHHTITLHDGPEVVGGLTALVHDGGLVAQHSFRSRAHAKLGIGDRLLDILFHWGAEQGYAYLDIGGADSGEYKNRWAPEGGWKASFGVHPRAPLAKRVVRRTRRLLQRATP
jgi:hypothetical protein